MGLLRFIKNLFLLQEKNAKQNSYIRLELEEIAQSYDCEKRIASNYFENVDNMSGSEFEEFCATMLEKSGFENVQISGKSGDQGVDILAKKDGIKYAIQCKCYSSDLGNTPVQEVFAGKNFYNCHVGAVMTNRFFTEGGRKLAEATGILLWDRNWMEDNARKCGMIEEELFKRISQNGDDYHSVQKNNATESNGDEMLPAAVDVILETGQASVSMIQRRLKLGYARAARIVDEMEDKGIVGPFQGSKPRDILITKDQWNRYSKIILNK